MSLIYSRSSTLYTPLWTPGEPVHDSNIGYSNTVADGRRIWGGVDVDQVFGPVVVKADMKYFNGEPDVKYSRPALDDSVLGDSF